MSLAAADFEHAMSQLLPQGAVWEQFRDRVHVLLAAMSQEPARLVTDASTFLESQIPDNASTDLDHFERIVGAPTEDLTDPERLSRIRSLLFGRRHVDRAYLEQVVQAMVGDSAVVTLFDRTFPPAAAGACNVGDSLASGDWDCAWLCESMARVGTTAPDTFTGGWSGLTSVSADAANSPVTLTATADAATIPSAGWALTALDASIPDDATVRATIWVKPTSNCQIRWGLRQQDGSTILY